MVIMYTLGHAEFLPSRVCPISALVGRYVYGIDRIKELLLCVSIYTARIDLFDYLWFLYKYIQHVKIFVILYGSALLVHRPPSPVTLSKSNLSVTVAVKL